MHAILLSCMGEVILKFLQKEQASIREAALAILTVEQRFWQMAMEAA